MLCPARAAFAANQTVVGELTALADSKNASISRLFLAWLLAQRNDIVPIPGSRNIARVTENTAAADLTLTADDLARTQDIVPAGGIGGRLTF